MRIVAGGYRAASGRRRWAIGPLAALAAVVAVCTGAIAAPSDGAPGSWSRFGGESRGLGRAAPAEVGRLAAVRDVLDRHAAALLHRDRAGWLAGLDPAAGAFRTRQAAVFDNLAAVPLSAWRYTVEPEDEAGEPGPGAGWTVKVTLRYGLRGADPAPTARTTVLTFTPRGERWLLAGDGRMAATGATTWRGPWEHGPLLVTRGRSSLVLAHPANADRAADFAAAVDAAVPRVTAVVGPHWPRQVAVLIPDDQREMASLVGERLALGKIAAVAVADSVDPSSGQARGQRVVVNPANLDRLGALGRRVVLQHEVTHVATRGFTGHGTPIWLVEGFADWVGYLGSGLSDRFVGDELRGQVGSGRWPGRLPTAADFRGDSPRLAVAYEESWSACRFVAARVGRAGLLRLYRMVGIAEDPAGAVDHALRTVLGMGSAEFVAAWRRSVRAEFG
jgi:hypothetical protein